MKARLSSGEPTGDWPEGWLSWPITRRAHVDLLEECILSVPEYPEGKYSGRGIVSCVSARPGWSSGKVLDNGYLPAAWCMTSELRRHGCDLPVYYANLGDLEWDFEMDKVVAPLGVTTHDLSRINREHPRPMRILNGWETKIFAIMESPFEEVLFLDADNLPLKNPEFLFDDPLYQDKGCVLWPDVKPVGRKEWLREDCWLNVGLPFLDAKAAESGQILINKRKCWKELWACRFLNEHSDYVYKWVFGDKDTFVLAWNKVAFMERRPPSYAMPERMPGSGGGSLIQYDLKGRALFQHLTLNKPTLDGFPLRTVLYRQNCEAHLTKLRRVWGGAPWRNSNSTPEELSRVMDLQGKMFSYVRDFGGRNHSRPMRLLQDRRIGKGMARLECEWNYWNRSGKEMIVLSDIDGVVTCFLYAKDDGSFQGNWARFEKNPAALIPA